MRERLVENWLINVNEKTFQVPFSQLLVAEGYTVLHMSRHGSFEEGKDIIAINENGTPCAFQLKGSKGKITSREWETYIPQVIRLVEIPIIFPGIDPGQKREVFFVTNGELEEEVRTEIHHRNFEWENRYGTSLQVVTKGEFLQRLLKIQSNFWPVELDDEKTLLELYLESGNGVLSKSKFTSFIGKLLDSVPDSTKEQKRRALVSASIFTSYALSPYEKKDNFVALIEGWALFVSLLIGYIEKNELDDRYWRSIYDIVVKEIITNLTKLFDEIRNRTNFISGNPLVDYAFHDGRRTWLAGFMALLGIWNNKNAVLSSQDDEKWISAFINKHGRKLLFWGEAAIPQILAVYWYARLEGVGLLADRILCELIEYILKENLENDKVGLPDPYHSIQEIVLNSSDISSTLRHEKFKGRSYMLQGLVDLLAKHDLRGVVSEYWEQITRVLFIKFIPNSSSDFCRWYNETGVLLMQMPQMTQSWKKLVDDAVLIDDSYIPFSFKENPILLLLLTIVAPHRMTPDVIKLIDDWIGSMVEKEISPLH